MNKTMTLVDLVARFGGPMATSRKLGYLSHATIHHWINNDQIPRPKWDEVRKLAEKEGVTIPRSFWIRQAGL